MYISYVCYVIHKGNKNRTISYDYTIFKNKNILNNFNTFLCDETRGDCIKLIVNILFAIKSITCENMPFNSH